MLTSLISTIFISVAICVILIAFTVLACEVSHKDEETTSEYLLEKDEFKIWVDPETGVEYIIYNGYGDRLAMTPRLNADGSLCVTEK